MKILIFSRKKLEAVSLKHFDEKTAVISISDYGTPPPALKNKPQFLLQLFFDDVDNDIFLDELPKNFTQEEQLEVSKKYHMFNDEDARDVSSFYHKYKDKTETLICQCEHGQSRSAAIAAAILEHRTKSGIKVFSNDLYFPNKVVFRKTLKALKENSQ